MNKQKVLLIILIVAVIFSLCGFFYLTTTDNKTDKDSKEKKTEQQKKSEKPKEKKKDSEKKKKEATANALKSAYTKENPLKIQIDPGHGGNDSGAPANVGGTTVYEKDVNLRIAKMLKEELEKYDNVKVMMTREGEENPDIAARVQMAIDNGADLLVSVHNNSYGGDFRYSDGTMVLAATGNFDSKTAEEDQTLGAYILRELKTTGLKDRGLLLRINKEGERYSNGNYSDYYGIVRRSTTAGLSGIIIEHAYIDNQGDYEIALSSDDKMRALAKADARGIAAYYRLDPMSRKTEIYETQTINMEDETEENTEYTPKFFELNVPAEGE